VNLALFDVPLGHFKLEIWPEPQEGVSDLQGAGTQFADQAP